MAQKVMQPGEDGWPATGPLAAKPDLGPGSERARVAGEIHQ
jgi:hypothetical protein